MENEDDLCYASSFRVLPDTCIELFVTYAGSRQTVSVTGLRQHPKCFIVSRMSKFMDVQNHGGSGFVSVCFHPGAAGHFFSVGMHEVSDMVVCLNDLWKSIAAEMEERVVCAIDNEERVSILQQYLLQQLEKQKRPDRDVEHWLWQVNYFKGQLTVEELSRRVNISQRQLGRRFNQAVGLSPKEFSRVTRFIHSLTYLKKYPLLSLTEIAYESGYYDQAHFIHDYKEYSGYTPGELIGGSGVLY